MITCKKCGNQNEHHARFCGSCGAFLEWVGEQAEKQAEEAGPGPVLPGPQWKNPPPRLATPSAQAQDPEDVVCEACGAGNLRGRGFCRQCGRSLAPPAVAVRPTWWRRLLTRSRRPVPAGTRPRWRNRSGGAVAAARGARSRARSALRYARMALMLGAVAGVGMGVGPWRADLGAGARKFVACVEVRLFQKPVAVVPVKARASSYRRNHPAARAIDGIIETYWAEGRAGDGQGEALRFWLERPVQLVGLGFRAGSQRTPQEFVTQPVPRQVRIVLRNSRGVVVERRVLTLDQTIKFQSFDIEAKDVVRIDLRILSVYRSQKGHAASLAEVEFFKRKTC